MLLRRFVTPGLSINSYLLCDEVVKKGIMIDPVRQADAYIARALQDEIEITDIIETHVHSDFLSGALDLKQALMGKPVIHCSGMGGTEWIPAYADHVVHHLEDIQVGSIRLRPLHTPGHTPEHLIWIVFDTTRCSDVPEIAFTGDLLFVGAIGRPDLLGKKWQDDLMVQLYQSIFATLYNLEDFIEIFPAHGAGSLCGKIMSMRESSTLGFEKKCNPALRKLSFELWKEELLQDLGAVPHYFQRIKQMNLQGPKPTSGHLPIFLDVEQLKQLAGNCLLVDTRSPAAFTNHYEGSINLPFNRSFSIYAAVALPEDHPIVLIVETAANVMEILNALSLIGIDRIEGIFTADQWQNAKTPLKKLPVIDVETLHKNISDYFILDVRTLGEWQSARIDQAHHIELANVLDALDQLPKNSPLAIICRVGNRSSMVASLLAKQKGFQPVNVAGGMQAWMQANLPLVAKN